MDIGFNKSHVKQYMIYALLAFLYVVLDIL